MKVRVGIIGGAGYTGGELIRLLVNHPQVSISFIHSRSNSKKLVSSVHQDLLGDTELIFSDDLSSLSNGSIDVLFLCVGHGEARKFLEQTNVDETIKIIDLSQDFRLHQKSTIANRQFVYGLPELNKEKIIAGQNIANPGCFATALQLGLLPMAKAGLLKNVYSTGITGSTGAGQSLSDTTHFTWRNNNVSVYKAFTHQHLKEIRQSLTQLQSGFEQKIHFVPYRGNFTRGILAACYTTSDLTPEEACQVYADYYAAHPFTHLSTAAVDVKRVVNTNKCLLHLEKVDDQLLITSVIDNLTKGASGQAVQNMNLLFGLDEKTGLGLKPVAF